MSTFKLLNCIGSDFDNVDRCYCPIGSGVDKALENVKFDYAEIINYIKLFKNEKFNM